MHDASMPKRKLTAHEVRRIAVDACTDTRTVERYLNKLPMKSTTAERVRGALERFNAAAFQREPGMSGHGDAA